MLPFDRLVTAADAWAAKNPEEDVLAQIGEAGAYEPRSMRWTRLMTPTGFTDCIDQSRLVIAHAGTGSYLLAAERGRPIVLLPRRAKLKEHTTDHQLHTAQWLREKPGVYVAMTETDVPAMIGAALSKGATLQDRLPPHAPNDFIMRIRGFLMG